MLAQFFLVGMNAQWDGGGERILLDDNVGDGAVLLMRSGSSVPDLEFQLLCTYIVDHKSYCSTVHFRGITSIYQPTNAHIKFHIKHFKTLRHVSISSDHHQGDLFHAKVILQYSQFNSYLQTRCCGGISCCVVEQFARCASYDAHLVNCSTTHSHNTSFENTNWIVNTVI